MFLLQNQHERMNAICIPHLSAALTDDKSSIVLEQKASDRQLALTDTDHWLHWSQDSLCQLQTKPSAAPELKEK